MQIMEVEREDKFSRDGASCSWRNTVPSDILPLYDATIQGDRKLVKKILDSKDIDINQTYGAWAETCLHTAVNQDDLKMCLLLLANDASTSATDKWGRTALHTSSSRGNLRISEELLKAGAPFMAKDKGGWIPLHMASSYGHRNICQLLIQQGSDIESLTNYGTTALHLGSANGHLRVCRVLMNAGSVVDNTNDIGMSALHYASKNAHSEICRLLISKGADILAKDMNDKTPLELWPTRAEQTESVNRAFGDGLKLRDYHQLMRAGSTPIQTVKLFLCGHPAVGKTSLKRALSKGRLKAKLTKWQTFRHSSHCATPGISVEEKYINGSGRFCVWDCAGQVEFHLTHSMFLGGDNGIFLIVYDATKSEEIVKDQISYWMSFIKAGHDPSKERRPSVVLVGTHFDQARNQTFAQKLSTTIMYELTGLFGQHLDICQETFLVDTRRPYRGDMISLRKTLGESADPLRGKLTPRMCDKIKEKKSSWCSGKYPVLKWNEMVDRAKVIDRYCEEDLVETAIDHLHDMGELHRAKIDGDDDVIILDPNWLTSAIFGPIFAKAGLRENYNNLMEKQLYTIEDLVHHFDLEDTNLLIQLMLYFELAQWYDEKKQLLTIPAKLPDNLAPVVWEEDPSYIMYTGRCLLCRDLTDMIAASVFPCLQVRIMRSFDRETHRPIISRMAIKFAHKVEGMVQLSRDRRAIIFAVRSKGEDEKTLQDMKAQLDELMLTILTILEQRSIGTQVVLRYLSPVCLRRSTDLETDVYSYSEEEVQMAQEEDSLLIDPQTNNTETVQDVIGPGYAKKVPNSILRWRHALRSSQDHFCSTIMPSNLLPYLTDIISQEEEQSIQTKESNEGAIRASRLLLDCLLRSTDTRWPDVLLDALDNIDNQHLKLILSEKFKRTS